MNKNSFYFLLVAMVSLFQVGCINDNATYRQMVFVDSLIHRNQPDSADIVLAKVKNTISTEKEVAYYGLLLMNIRYMQYRPLKSDTLISKSIKYYEKIGDNEKLAESYLAKSKNLYSRGFVHQSVIYAKECEKLIPQINNLSLESELYRFLSRINTKGGDYNAGLKYARKALYIAESNDRGTWKVSSYSRMAITFAKLGDADSACFYINKCIPYLDYFFPKDRVVVMDNIGYLNQERNPELALKYLNMALATYPSVDTYDNLARIYAKQGKKVKADSLWQKALQTKDVGKRCAIVGAMLKQKKDEGDQSEILMLSQRLLVLKDSVNKLRQENNVRELQKEFDANETIIAQQEHIRNMMWVICFGIIVIGLMILIGWLYVRNRRLKILAERLDRTQKMQQYQATITLLRENEQKAQSTISNMVKSDNTNQRTIERLNNKLKKMQEQTIEDERKACLLYKSAMQGSSISEWKKAEQQAFLDYYFHIDFSFLSSLDTYDSLSPREKVYLVLLHEGMEEEQVKNMMGISDTSMRVLKSRIKSKMQL